jgi:hypothetical protein
MKRLIQPTKEKVETATSQVKQPIRGQIMNPCPERLSMNMKR